MSTRTKSRSFWLAIAPRIRLIAVWGPGLLVMLADNDVGQIVTAAQAGAQWRYRLLPVVLGLIPVLYMVQELTVRLGIETRRGFGQLVREQFGALWAWLAVIGLGIGVIASLVTELAGAAGIGELYGVSRSITLPLSSLILLSIAATGSYKRVERVVLVVGLCEVAFFAAAWMAHPDPAAMLHDGLDLPMSNGEFRYLALAIIGASFNPWMIFYQQSAIAEKKLGIESYRAARWDTGVGAVVTQCLTAAVLVAAAATLIGSGPSSGLTDIGEVSQALLPVLGNGYGKVVFGAGVLGASLVAAIVASLALAWGVGEVAGYNHQLEPHPLKSKRFGVVYAASVVGSAILVSLIPDLVWLNIAAQVVNAILLPMLIGFLVALVYAALPTWLRPARWYIVLLVGSTAAVVALAVWSLF